MSAVLAFLISMLVFFTLIMSAIFAFISLRRMHQRKYGSGEVLEFDAAEGVSNPSSLFEKPPRWLALKTSNLSKVQSVLGVHNPIPCSWAEGLASSREHKLFISPPVQGWILVFGAGVPDPADDVDRCYHLITRLSHELGQVQFYVANQVLGHHAWVRAENGRIQRAYAWAGETLWNQGPITIAEQIAGVRCYAYGELVESALLQNGEASATNAEKVLFLASRWSLDPTSITDPAVRSDLGIVGDLR